MKLLLRLFQWGTQVYKKLLVHWWGLKENERERVSGIVDL